MKKFKKGDLVYDEQYDRLMIIQKHCCNPEWVFCGYSYNPTFFYYLEVKHLTLISKGEFK